MGESIIENLFWRALFVELATSGANVEHALRRTAPAFAHLLTATPVPRTLAVAGVADAESAFQPAALPQACACPLVEAVLDIRVPSDQLQVLLLQTVVADSSRSPSVLLPGVTEVRLVQDSAALLQVCDAAVQPVFTCNLPQGSSAMAPCAACARPTLWRTVPPFMLAHSLLASAMPASLPLTAICINGAVQAATPTVPSPPVSAATETPRLFSPASWFAGHARVFTRVASAPEQHAVAARDESPKPRTTSLPDTTTLEALTDKPHVSTDITTYDAAELHAALLARVHAPAWLHTFVCSEDELYDATLRRRAHDDLCHAIAPRDVKAASVRMCEDVGALRTHEAWQRGLATHSSDVYVTCAVFTDVCSNDMAHVDAQSTIQALVTPRCVLLCSRYPFFDSMRVAAISIVSAMQAANAIALQTAYACRNTPSLRSLVVLRGLACTLTRPELARMRELTAAVDDHRAAIEAAATGRADDDETLASVTQMRADALQVVQSTLHELTTAVVTRCRAAAVVSLEDSRGNVCSCTCDRDVTCTHAAAAAVRGLLSARVPLPGDVLNVLQQGRTTTRGPAPTRARRASFDPGLLRGVKSDTVGTPPLARPALLPNSQVAESYDRVSKRESESYVRPREPWRWLLRDKAATPRAGSRPMPPPLSALTHLVRAFVEDMPPLLMPEARSTAIVRLGAGLMSSETTFSLIQWALPVLASLLDARSIAHVLTSMLTEQNIIFVAPPGAFGDATNDVLSRCVLACTCLCTPLHWQQRLRAVAPAATAAALALNGADALVHANIMSCTAFASGADGSTHDCTLVHLESGAVVSSHSALTSHLHMPGIDDLITALAHAQEGVLSQSHFPLLTPSLSQREACARIAIVAQEHVRWLLTHMFVAIAPRSMLDDASAALQLYRHNEHQHDDPALVDVYSLQLDLNALPTLRDVQGATSEAGAFWRRFGSSLMLQQHVSMRYSRALHSAGSSTMLVTSDCTDLIHGVIADVTALTTGATPTDSEAGTRVSADEAADHGAHYSPAIAEAIAANVQRSLTYQDELDVAVDAYVQDAEGVVDEDDTASGLGSPSPAEALTFLSPSWFARSFRLAGNTPARTDAITAEAGAATQSPQASVSSLNLQAAAVASRFRRLFS